jgi:superkiller protein 3
MTSAMAPKDAKKAWEKGKEHLKKNKLAEAQKELEKAVQIYPKYAVAWYDLGTVHQQNKNFDGARKAYAESLNADSKYVMPHLQLAVLALNEQKWEEVADATEKVIKLNPVSFPQAFFFNSIANYNLQRYDEALESAHQAVKLDQRHQWPKAQHVLGVLLAMKGDNQAALENMRGYLKFSPKAGDADNVRQQISDIEARLSGGAAPANNQER